MEKTSTGLLFFLDQNHLALTLVRLCPMTLGDFCGSPSLLVLQKVGGGGEEKPMLPFLIPPSCIVS